MHSGSDKLSPLTGISELPVKEESQRAPKEKVLAPAIGGRIPMSKAWHVRKNPIIQGKKK